MTGEPLRESASRTSGGRGLRVCVFVLLFAACAVPPVVVRVSHDCGWFLWEAGAMLDGMRLYVDVPELNPPLIPWLTVPPVWIARLAGLSAPLVFKLCVAALALASILLCRGVLARLFSDESRAERRVLLFAAMVVLLDFIPTVVPGLNEFGQREHLALIFVLPYAMLAGARAAKAPLAGPLPLVIGLLAGVGIAIKPYFLAVWLLIEAWLWLVRRAGPFWRRPESLSVVLVHAAYAGLILLFARDYFPVVRMMSRVYGVFDVPWNLLLVRWEFALAALAFAAFLLSLRFGRCRQLRTALTLAMLGFLAAALVQHKGFWYHYIPVTSLAALVLATVGIDLSERARGWKVASVSFRPLLLGAMLLVLCALPAREMRHAALAGDRWEQSISGKLCRAVQNRAAGAAVASFTSSIYPTFPMINYSGARYAPKVGALFMLPGLQADNAPAARAANADLRQFVIDSVVDDMRTLKPRLVIVDVAPEKETLRHWRFEFLPFLLEDDRFRDLWTHYVLVDKIESYEIYERRK